MSTVYNIEVETCSAFCNYTEEEMNKIFKEMVDNYRHPDNGLRFESTVVKSKRKENY